MKYWKFIFGNIWKLYVGFIFFLTGFLLYPLYYLALSAQKTKKFTFKLSILWSRLIQFFCLYPIRKKKVSPLPEGPYIIVANHASYLDIFLICSVLPEHPFVFLGKSELLNYPLLRTYFRKLHIPVFRNDRMKAAKSFIQAKKAVQEGWSLMIFPEGGIADENLPKMMPFKEGAFKLAKGLNIPIVPLTFSNNHLLFTDPGEGFGGARPGISDVYIHPFVSVEKIQSMTEKELSDYCFDIINEPLKALYPSIVS